MLSLYCTLTKLSSSIGPFFSSSLESYRGTSFFLCKKFHKLPLCLAKVQWDYPYSGYTLQGRQNREGVGGRRAGGHLSRFCPDFGRSVNPIPTFADYAHHITTCPLPPPGFLDIPTALWVVTRSAWIIMVLICVCLFVCFAVILICSYFLKYSHLSNKRDVTLTDFGKFHPAQN